MDDKKLVLVDSNSANADPLSKEAGFQAVGTALGSARGVITGVAVGSAFDGPIGALVGTPTEAVAGGAAGRTVGEAITPTVERDYWSKTFKDRPYYKPGKEYSDYEPAYRFGWESARRQEYQGKDFDEVESELQGNWTSDRGPEDPWTDARDATRDAWLKVRTQG